MSSVKAPDSPHESTPSSIARAIERAGQQATRAAVRDHLQAGRAVYYTDSAYPEGTVKELPDGRRLLVCLDQEESGQPSEQGEETVLREIEPRREESAGQSAVRSVTEQ